MDRTLANVWGRLVGRATNQVGQLGVEPWVIVQIDAELARLRAQDVVVQLRAIDDVMMQAGIEPQGSPRLNVLELIRQWQYEAEQHLACGRELDRERQRVHDLTVALDENRKMTIAANQAAGKAEAELARLRAPVSAELRMALVEIGGIAAQKTAGHGWDEGVDDWIGVKDIVESALGDPPLVRAPVTAELREIGERHTKVDADDSYGYDTCACCGDDWPCSVALLWRVIEALQLFIDEHDEHAQP